MEWGSYTSSENYLYEIKHNESFFKNTKLTHNIKPLWSLRGHTNSIEGVHIINNKEFVTVSHDCVISFWDLERKNLNNIKVQYPILSSSFNKKKKIVAVGLTNKDTNICLVDVEKYKLSEKVNTKSDSIFCLNYYDDNIITCGSKSGSILLLDLTKKKSIYRYEEIDDCISSCSFNSIHNIHFFGTYRGTVSLFDFRNPLPIYKNKYFHSEHSVNAIFSFNNCIFTAGSDCLIKKFDIRYFDENKPLYVYMGHTSPVHFLSFSPKFLFFCSSSDNGCIRLWKNEEKIDTIQSICSPVIDGKLKENRNLLSVNMGRDKKNNLRSNVGISDKRFTKNTYLLKNENLKIKEQFMLNKRALTPNIPKTHERNLSSTSKQHLFTATQKKASDGKSSLLYNLKPDYSKKTTTRESKVSSTLYVPSASRLRPSSSINPPVRRSYLKSRGTIDTESKKKDSLKISENKQIETKQGKHPIDIKIMSNKKNNTNTQQNKLIANKLEDIVHSKDDLSFVFKSESEYAIISMLHHKNRVSSMDWLKHSVLSVSWDQTIKCWDLSKYVQ